MKGPILKKGQLRETDKGWCWEPLTETSAGESARWDPTIIVAVGEDCPKGALTLERRKRPLPTVTRHEGARERSLVFLSFNALTPTIATKMHGHRSLVSAVRGDRSLCASCWVEDDGKQTPRDRDHLAVLGLSTYFSTLIERHLSPVEETHSSNLQMCRHKVLWMHSCSHTRRKTQAAIGALHTT